MRIRILGSAAGGRFPQWNCACGNCVAVRGNRRQDVAAHSRRDAGGEARHEKFSFKARTQAQLALSADGSTWFLAGASPDLAFQIEELRRSSSAGFTNLHAIRQLLAWCSGAPISTTSLDCSCSASCSL